MTFKEYILEAKKTLSFENDQKLIYCCTTGLLGEYGEYVQHFLSLSKSELIIKELGDVFWYLAVLSDYLNLTLNQNPKDVIASDKLTGFILIYQIQETLKKSVRDYNQIITLDNKEALNILFSRLYSFLILESSHYDVTLDEVWTKNIQKLASRKQRGKIQGKGDDR